MWTDVEIARMPKWRIALLWIVCEFQRRRPVLMTAERRSQLVEMEKTHELLWRSYRRLQAEKSNANASTQDTAT